MVGCALAVIRVGPGGRHCALGSLAWSTFLYLSAPWGVRMSCCPGSVSFEMSLMEPPNQTPVRSGWGTGGREKHRSGAENFEIGRILRRPHDRLRDHLAPLTLLGLHRRTSGQ